jgi:hypothetical protein
MGDNTIQVGQFQSFFFSLLIGDKNSESMSQRAKQEVLCKSPDKII